MWTVKHFQSEADAMAWVSMHPVQWERVFCENQPYSIEYRPIRILLEEEE